jgi:hypothetical protein
MADPAKVLDQNLLPVQAYFAVDGTFQTFIGQGQPFYATLNPNQSGLAITLSTIDSSPIGSITPSTGVFTNVSATTGQISTTPSGNTDIANKYYVDQIAQGLSPKQAVKCGTVANITLSGLQTIDGYTTLAGDRVLVKNQSTSSQNGIYIASASAWTRSTDMDVWSEVPGAYTVILNGSANANTAWVCTAADTGTIGVTAMPWVQFSGSGTYFAGTGLTLASNTFSITNTGVTAASVGSASKTLTATVNAQGQLTALADTNIAISNSQVSGLGTMSTQNAGSVAITGGTIDGVTIGGTTASAITGTTVTAASQFSGPGTGLTGTASGLSIGGSAASATTAGSVTNSLTVNSGGSGGVSPQTFNGSSAVTISYNTIGAPSTTGTGASGTWAIGISGNAATVTNGLYSTGSYSNPTWLTSILGSIVSGAVSTATTATNVAGGAAGSLLYQSGADTTSMLSLGTADYVLTAGSSAPKYVAQSTLSVGSATTSTTSTNLAGGVAGAVPWQSGVGATGFTAAGTTGQVLTSNGTSAPTWTSPSASVTVSDDTTTVTARYPLFASVTTGTITTEYVSSTKLQYIPSTGELVSTTFSGAGTGLTGTATSLNIGGNAATATSATTATNIAGGTANQIPYQTGSGATSFITAPVSSSTVLTWNGTAFTWASGGGSSLTISDDTTTNAVRYPLFANATTGTVTTEYVSSTKYKYNPSTGELTAPAHISSNGLTLNSQTVSTNYTIASGNNALSAGPVSVATGITVTVSSGSVWTVV